MVWPLNPNTMLSMQPEKHKVLMPGSQLQRTICQWHVHINFKALPGTSYSQCRMNPFGLAWPLNPNSMLSICNLRHNEVKDAPISSMNNDTKQILYRHKYTCIFKLNRLNFKCTKQGSKTNKPRLRVK